MKPCYCIFFIRAPGAFITATLRDWKNTMIQKPSGHTACSCLQYSFEWRQIVSFLPPSIQAREAQKFHFITRAHCDFFLCDAENYRPSVQLMCFRMVQTGWFFQFGLGVMDFDQLWWVTAGKVTIQECQISEKYMIECSRFNILTVCLKYLDKNWVEKYLFVTLLAFNMYNKCFQVSPFLVFLLFLIYLCKKKKGILNE